MRTIIIQKTDAGCGWHIIEGDKFAYGLAWDEMLGQIARLTLPGREDEKSGMNTLTEAYKALNEKIEGEKPVPLASLLEAHGWAYDPAGGYNGQEWRDISGTYHHTADMVSLLTKQIAYLIKAEYC